MGRSRASPREGSLPGNIKGVNDEAESRCNDDGQLSGQIGLPCSCAKPFP